MQILRTSYKMTPFDICKKAKNEFGITKVVLSFSCGKDSIAGWICLRECGIDVVPVYKFQFPDLQFEQNTVKFYEGYFGCKIHQVPHRSFYSIFNQLLFQDPFGIRLIEDLDIFEHPSNDEILNRWKKQNGCEADTTCLCIKKPDSAQRAIRIVKAGEITCDRRFIYPMANCGDQMVFTILRKFKCPLPSFYKDIGESFDTLRIPVMDWIKKNSPEDWSKIKRWMPLIETEYGRIKTHS